MPVTVKLSRKFYETFGDDIANELVSWFNQVDSTYRNELRELNELNFARFDAKVEQRFAESDAKLERRFAQLEVKGEQRFVQLEVKWEQRFAEFEVKWEQRFTQLEGQVGRQLARIDTQLAETKTELAKSLLNQTRWMMGLWATVAVAVLGLYLR